MMQPNAPAQPASDQPSEQPQDDVRGRVMAVLAAHGIQASPEDIDQAISLLQGIFAPDEQQPQTEAANAQPQ